MRLPTRLMWTPLVAWSIASVSVAGMMTVRLGGGPTGGPAPVEKATGKPPTGYVAETKTPPTIDGKLNDPVWGGSQVLRLERTLDGSARASQPTEVRLLRDARTLYVALRCLEPFVSKIRASRRTHDEDLWGDDSVEIFIGTDDDWDYYHFIVNSLGATYDGFNENKSWNCGAGLRAAGAVAKSEWTAEMAIPLERVAFGGKIPTRWIANFNRNRHARGRWDELSWSPTMSGQSHVPRKFGRLIFEDPPKELLAAPRKPAAAGGAVRVLKCAGGAGVLRFDLAALPTDAPVFRADLVVRRSGKLTGRDDEILTDIEIYPLTGAFTEGGAPRPEGRPLALRGPWFDRFDATEAVRACMAGKARPPRAHFFVKTFPLWNASASCLEIACRGEPKDVPPQVSGLRVRHRAGQTFITWKEIDDPVGSIASASPPSGKDQVKWAELRSILAGLDGKREVRYCIYRSDGPINAESLHAAERIATVKPLSCWNVNGRNIEKPIDALLSGYAMIHGQWNPFSGASADGKYGLDCLMDRLVIEDGGSPLPRGTGLYVHTATEAGKFHYAVVTAIDGVQNTTAFSQANSLTAPVAEATGEGAPVLQKILPPRPFWDYGEARHHYVRWVAPPYGNLPCRYHNWAVAVPNKLGKSVPLELSLHRDGRSYYVTQYRIDRTSIVVCPHDFPMKTWWFGYHSSAGTLKSFRRGAIHNYTERRILSFVEWVCKKWPVDRSRTIVTGMNAGAAAGARRLSARHRKVFRRCVARGGGRVPMEMAERVWGKGAWELKADTGRPVWVELRGPAQ